MLAPIERRSADIGTSQNKKPEPHELFDHSPLREHGSFLSFASFFLEAFPDIYDWRLVPVE